MSQHRVLLGITTSREDDYPYLVAALARSVAAGQHLDIGFNPDVYSEDEICEMVSLAFDEIGTGPG